MAQHLHWYDGYERRWNPQIYSWDFDEETLGLGGVIAHSYYRSYRFDGSIDLDLDSIPGDPDGIVVMAWLTVKITPSPTRPALDQPKGGWGGRFYVNFDGPAGYGTSDVSDPWRGGSSDVAPPSLEAAPKPYAAAHTSVEGMAWQDTSWEYVHFRAVLDPYSLGGVAFPLAPSPSTVYFHGPPTESFPGGWPRWADDFTDPTQTDTIPIDAPSSYALVRGAWPTTMWIQWDFNAWFALQNWRGEPHVAELVSDRVYLFPVWWDSDAIVPPGKVVAEQSAGGARRLGRVVGGGAGSVEL